MKILYGKEYHNKVLNPLDNSFQPQDRDRCLATVEKFRDNPRHPGLNFERLGKSRRKNHWSIRASQELRVILAVELKGGQPRRVGLLNMGHHDPMYAWSRGQGYNTDLDEYGVVWAAPESSDNRDLAIPPSDFKEWMLYLPKQHRRLVNRHYHSGMGRIRGAAGTGKTVVALHRAVVLGRRYPGELILVTSFIRSLCVYMESLFQRFPDPPDNVRFVNVDKLAYKFLRRPTDKTDESRFPRPRDINTAFKAACKLTVPQESKLDDNYLKEEVQYVIKGRDAKKEEFLDTGRFERLGRKQSFKKADREICWRLREAWDQEMKQLGTVDFPDRLVEARNQAEKQSKPRYRAAIVDEAQDLTLVGIQFVRALVAGSPKEKLRKDSILMLDDSAQRIYPGGFRPKWAKLDFRGNSDNLDVNFRNTKRIYQAARAVGGEVTLSRGDNDDGSVEASRFEGGEGDRPFLIVTNRKELHVLLGLIKDLVEKERYRHKEIGVLVLRNDDVKDLMKFLRGRGMPCVNLEDLRNGPLGDGIRVGTFDRAKGMTYRAVFIPRMGESQFPFRQESNGSGIPAQAALQLPGNTSTPPMEENQEERQLKLDRLYVAMTRARDRLYLIADEDPCHEIQRARDFHFNENPSLAAL